MATNAPHTTSTPFKTACWYVPVCVCVCGGGGVGGRGGGWVGCGKKEGGAGYECQTQNWGCYLHFF